MLSNTSIMPYQVITNTLSLLSNFINMFFGRGAPEGKLLSLEEGGQEKKDGEFFMAIFGHMRYQGAKRTHSAKRFV